MAIERRGGDVLDDSEARAQAFCAFDAAERRQPLALASAHKKVHFQSLFVKRLQTALVHFVFRVRLFPVAEVRRNSVNLATSFMSSSERPRKVLARNAVALLCFSSKWPSR